MSDYELCHYGVLGMKWGVRKANKKGVDHTYRSRGQKKYAKKLERAQSKENVNPKKVEKYTNKLDMYEARDRRRQEYAQNTSVGKTVAKGLLFGPFGSGNYNRMRSSGHGRFTTSLMSNAVSSTFALPVTVLLTKSMENDAAREDVRTNKRVAAMFEELNKKRRD